MNAVMILEKKGRTSTAPADVFPMRQERNNPVVAMLNGKLDGNNENI